MAKIFKADILEMVKMQIEPVLSLRYITHYSKTLFSQTFQLCSSLQFLSRKRQTTDINHNLFMVNLLIQATLEPNKQIGREMKLNL